jgi:ABC-type sugar transport system substrate-binding protein
MVEKIAKIASCLALLVVLGAASVLATAQTASDKMSSDQTVTGCVQQGQETNGFFLVTSDGKHWELYPSGDVSLAEHVGHTVTVTGSTMHRTAAQEKVSQPFEKKEIAGKDHGDWQVTSVKMVSETCSK